MNKWRKTWADETDHGQSFTVCLGQNETLMNIKIVGADDAAVIDMADRIAAAINAEADTLSTDERIAIALEKLASAVSPNSDQYADEKGHKGTLAVNADIHNDR